MRGLFSLVIGILLAGATAGPAAAQDYFTDIRPLLAGRCATCHTAGGIAWSMDDDEVTYGRRQLIAAAILGRQMPPWLAEQGHQQYVDDPTLGIMGKGLPEAGTKESFYALDPMTLVLIKTDIEFKGETEVEVEGEKQRALWIHASEPRGATDFYLDREGNMLFATSVLGITMRPITREEALGDSGPAPILDLAYATSIHKSQGSQRNRKILTSNKTPPRRKAPWAIPLITGLLLSSGCVIGSEESPGGRDEELPGSEPSEASTGGLEEGDQEVLASSISTSTNIGSELKIDIYALERIGDKFIRLTLGVTNNSDSDFNLGYGLSRPDTPLNAGDVSLIDGVKQQRYLSYSLSDGNCFCNSLDGALASGSSETLWVVYPAPPEELDAMTVITPLTPPMMDIPISNSSESVESINLEEPEIIDLIGISDDTETQTGRTEDGEEVSIILSSDVLFDTNSSELSNDAQEILDQVAQEIDDASASTISIDGYADNTGNDSINIPLSRDRADSVESALSELITREGIYFESEGYGSADPIASNDTEEGRERNRRVTVTFEK